MSTFTNILQQKINNLEAQIRQLQEQNYNLRNKARWLMEAAAASSDMSMLQPTVQNEPMGQYTGANPNSTYTMGVEPILPYGPTPTYFPDVKDGQYLGDKKGNRNQFYWNSVIGGWVIHVYSSSGKVVGTYVWSGERWVQVNN